VPWSPDRSAGPPCTHDISVTAYSLRGTYGCKLVDAGGTGAGADGNEYGMNCTTETEGTDQWIACSGGNQAVVYIF
jgi:hypothetical protein